MVASSRWPHERTSLEIDPRGPGTPGDVASHLAPESGLRIASRDEVSGDERGSDFHEVFREHFRFVCITLRRLGVREGDLEDIAQEVFVAVHRKLDSYDSNRPLTLWLFGFCLRAASTHRRRAHHRRWLHQDVEPEVAHGAPLQDDQIIAAENRRLVEDALDALDPDRRTVFVMHDMNEFSASHIAEMLSIPQNTVYSRLRLAREEFRKAVHRLRAQRGQK